MKRSICMMLVALVCGACISCSEDVPTEASLTDEATSLAKARWQDAGVAADKSTIIDTTKLVYGPGWDDARFDATYVLQSFSIPNLWSPLEYFFTAAACIVKDNVFYAINFSAPYELRAKNDMIWLKLSFLETYVNTNEVSLAFIGEKTSVGYAGTAFTWYSDDDSEIMYFPTYANWIGITKQTATNLIQRPFYKQ